MAMAIPIAMVAATVISTAMQANAQKQAGQAAAVSGAEQQQAENYQAQELATQAGQIRAQSQHQGEIIQRDTDLAVSHGRMAAAASGTTTTSPGVVTALGRVAGRGAYDLESALASGEAHARALETRGALDIYQGQEARQAGGVTQSADNTRAIGTIFGGASSLFAKYGMPGPPSGSPAAYNSFNPSGATTNLGMQQAYPGFDFSQAG